VARLCAHCHDEAKARELAKVDRLEREYWTAWGRSCKDAETLRQEGSGEKPSRVVKIKRPRNGDPAFLRGVQWCIERRCKIIGVDAPSKSELTGKDGREIVFRIGKIDLDKDI